jgi:ribosomal biogenesis protein LAS1
MVQYVFTPWRDRQELLRVRRQLYPRPPPPSNDNSPAAPAPVDAAENAEKHRAIARVLMWTHRGGCPHMVESTALLMAAILQDGATGARGRGRGSSAAAEDYAVLAAYLTAFTR